MLGVGLSVCLKFFGFVRTGGGDVGNDGSGFLHITACDKGLFSGIEDDDTLASSPSARSTPESMHVLISRSGNSNLYDECYTREEVKSVKYPSRKLNVRTQGNQPRELRRRCSIR